MLILGFISIMLSIDNTMLLPEILGNLNINLNKILISLQWLLIVELYRYLCWGLPEVSGPSILS